MVIVNADSPASRLIVAWANPWEFKVSKTPLTWVGRAFGRVELGQAKRRLTLRTMAT